jgi:type III secretion protein T
MNEVQGFFDLAVRYLEPFGDLFLTVSLASLRLFAAFNVLPAMGEQLVQGYIRTGFIVIMGGFIAFGLPLNAVNELSAAQWFGFALKESMIGLLLGFAGSTVFWIAESVGALIDTQAGYNSVQLNNPLSGQQSTPVSNLLLQLVVCVFFQLGGMLVFIGAVFESFHAWPLFSPLPELSKLPDLFIVRQTDALMSGIVKFAAPMLLVLVLIDLGFGFITRAADKLEPNSLSQPIKGAVTMLMLALLVGVLITQVRHLLLPTGLLAQLQSSLGTR